MDKRLKVGNKCYLKAQGNEERYHRGKSNDEWIYEAEIINVGRKYFTVKKKFGMTLKYSIDDLSEVTNYCSDWKFYFDKQQALDEMEKENLEFRLRLKFSSLSATDLDIDKLRRIMDIINE